MGLVGKYLHKIPPSTCYYVIWEFPYYMQVAHASFKYDMPINRFFLKKTLSTPMSFIIFPTILDYNLWTMHLLGLVHQIVLLP